MSMSHCRIGSSISFWCHFLLRMHGVKQTKRARVECPFYKALSKECLDPYLSLIFFFLNNSPVFSEGRFDSWLLFFVPSLFFP